MPFCIKCGRRVPDGADFCPNCGAPVTPVVAAPTVESALFTMEGFKGVPASRNLLVFTDRRLIVALVSGEVKPFLAAGVIGELKERSKMKKLKKKTIEELLSDKKNYAIPYDEINSIEVTEGGTLKSGSITVNRTAGEPEKIYAYPRDVKKRIDDFNKLLKPILGERLIVKR